MKPERRRVESVMVIQGVRRTPTSSVFPPIYVKLECCAPGCVIDRKRWAWRTKKHHNESCIKTLRMPAYIHLEFARAWNCVLFPLVTLTDLPKSLQKRSTASKWKTELRKTERKEGRGNQEQIETEEKRWAFNYTATNTWKRKKIKP